MVDWNTANPKVINCTVKNCCFNVNKHCTHHVLQIVMDDEGNIVCVSGTEYRAFDKKMGGKV